MHAYNLLLFKSEILNCRGRTKARSHLCYCYSNEYQYFVVTTEVASTPMPLVCSASWGEGPDYNLVPTPKGHCQLK
jgi:hypothetical protein